MVSSSYSEAATEVLEILKHTKKEDVAKIPKKFIEFLESYSSKTYQFEFDHTKPLKELNLKPKTHAILGIIYLKYWANFDQQKSFRKKLYRNEILHNKKIREKYNPDNIFKNKK